MNMRPGILSIVEIDIVNGKRYSLSDFFTALRTSLSNRRYNTQVDTLKDIILNLFDKRHWDDLCVRVAHYNASVYTVLFYYAEPGKEPEASDNEFCIMNFVMETDTVLYYDQPQFTYDKAMKPHAEAARYLASMNVWFSNVDIGFSTDERIRELMEIRSSRH